MWRNTEAGKNKYLPLLATGNTITVFDTETTGLGCTAKIIQFSAIQYQITDDGMHEIDHVDILINPEEPLQDKIIELTGITDEMLADKKIESEQFDIIREIMESADLWAAYNCNFDLRMIKQMEDRLGRKIKTCECIDIYMMAKDLIPAENIENFKLSTVMGYVHPEYEANYHSAIEDARATGVLLQTFRKMYREYEDKMSGKLQAHLEYAYYWENPKQPSQKRIKLKLNNGEYGDIFWDILKKSWGCKSTPKAKKVFETLDIKNIEQQVMNRYAWRYKADSMDMLAYEWAKAKRKQASI